MLMSNLIERYEAAGVGGPYSNPLARALVKTGPLIHRDWCYSAKVRYGRRQLVASRVRHPRGARDAASVEVPWGTLPGFPGMGVGSGVVDSAMIGHFKGFAQSLESGKATVGNPGDAESLASDLESLADELRHWSLLNDLVPKLDRLVALYAGRKTGRVATSRRRDAT
jgi:hypothetical protein